jgi:hypothetical protein
MFTGIAQNLRRMMIESYARTGHIRQVGCNVTVGDWYFAILHVLGVNEQDFVDHVELLEQDGADKTIKVAAGD